MAKQGQSVPLVVKPVLRGSWHGPDATRLGLRMMLSILLVTLIYVVLSLLFSFDLLALRIVTSLMIVAAAFAYLYRNGMNAGQNDAAFAEIMYGREQEGKPVSDSDRARCFHPMKGYWIALVGVTPFLIAAIVFAFLAKPATYTLGVLPQWMNGYLSQNELGDALSYYGRQEGVSALAVLRIAVRAMSMPLINVAVKLGDHATLWAERLSPLWVLIAPLGYGVGYGQGLNQRIRINTAIAIGDRKKMRRSRKEHRARIKTREPERLV